MSTSVSTPATPAAGVMDVLRAHWVELLAWAAFIVYWVPAFQYFWIAWGNPDGYYSHGYLIPLMAGWTAWLKRGKLASMTPRPSIGAFVPLLLFLGLATLAGAQNSQTMRGLAFPISLGFFVAALYGWGFVKELAFPILYLYFLTPIPEFLLLTVAFKVQIWSTTLATFMSRLFFVDPVQVGTSIHTDNVELLVGAPCSGFRMLVALTAFAVFLVYAVKGELWRKVLFVLIAMPLSVMVNSLRVALLVLVGHYWDATLVPVLHDYSGYVVLIVAFVLMYWIARLLGCREFRLMESS